LLRCPLCEAEFAAARVLADSVRFPPLAIVVTPPNSSADAGRAPPADVPPPATTDLGPPASDDLAARGFPESEPALHSPTMGEGGLDLLGEPSDDRPAGPPAESEHFDAVVEDSATGEQPFDTSTDRFALGRRAETIDGPAADTSADIEPDVEPSTAGASDDITEAEDDRDAGFKAPLMHVSTQPRPRPSGFTSLVAQFFGVIIGGAMGLAIGYYILLWFAGAKADALDLRSRLPSWLLPPIREQFDLAARVPPRISADTIAKIQPTARDM
jgi:hypothetical protein